MYPQGIPFKPPEELVVQESRLQRWTLFLVLGTMVALIVTIGTGIYFVSRISRVAEEILAKKADPISDKENKLLTTPVPPAPPKVDIIEVPQETVSQETLDLLIGAHINWSFSNIISLANEKFETDNDVEQAQKRLMEVVEQLKQVDGQLDFLAKNAATDSEVKSGLEYYRLLYELLHKQAKELNEYWNDPTDEQWAKYLEAYQAVYDEISRQSSEGMESPAEQTPGEKKGTEPPLIEEPPAKSDDANKKPEPPAKSDDLNKKPEPPKDKEPPTKGDDPNKKPLEKETTGKDKEPSTKSEPSAKEKEPDKKAEPPQKNP